MKNLTEFQFRESAALRTELDALLKNATLSMALGVVEDKARPRYFPEPKPNAHLDTLTSQKFHYNAGIQFAVDLITRLCSPNPSEVEDESYGDPYFYTLPEAMQEAIKKKRLENP